MDLITQQNKNVETRDTGLIQAAMQSCVSESEAAEVTPVTPATPPSEVGCPDRTSIM